MSKDTREKELSQKALDFYKAEVARIRAMYGTAQAFDLVTGQTITVTLAQHRAGKQLAGVIADQLGDPYLLDLTPVDPIVAELRARAAASTGDYEGE